MHLKRSFSFHAFKVRDTKTNQEGYLLIIYPEECRRSICATFVHTQALNDKVLKWLSRVANVISSFYPALEEEEEEEEEKEARIISPEELEHYEILEALKRGKYVRIRELQQ